jgi:hypothetical protein
MPPSTKILLQIAPELINCPVSSLLSSALLHLGLSMTSHRLTALIYCRYANIFGTHHYTKTMEEAAAVGINAVREKTPFTKPFYTNE